MTLPTRKLLAVLFFLFEIAYISPCVMAQPKPIFKLVFEKAYLHTDREIYAPGDTLWFKAYLMDAQTQKLSSSSHTLYVELIAPNSTQIVRRELIRLDKGLGNGDIELMDTLRSGTYRLRAYTNWMRNFGNNFIFEKEISVLDTRSAAASAGQQGGASGTQPRQQNSFLAASAPVVRFYPEGGSLMEGVSSLVAVKAEDPGGKGWPVTGAIIASSGDTVSRFSCDSSGMGLFTLLPLQGKTYQAAVRLKNNPNNILIAVPAALHRGLALQVRQADSVIHILVQSADLPASKTADLVIKHQGKPLFTEHLQLQNRQAAIRVPVTILPEGISAITLYDSLGRANCERLIYIHHAVQTDNLTLATSQKSYHTHDQVTVSIQAPPGANLSMAAAEASTVPVSATNISAYLYLQSELKGNIENAGRYFDKANPNRFKQLDLLLLTQGWRDFIWRRLADTTIRISYAAENGITVAGHIQDGINHKRLTGLNITLYAPAAKSNKLLSARSDSTGRFLFDDVLLYGRQNVTLTALNDKEKTKGAFSIDTLAFLPVTRTAAPFYRLEDAFVQTAAGQFREQQATIAKLKGINQLREVRIKARSKNAPVTFKGVPGTSYTTWGKNFDQDFNITAKDSTFKTLLWFALNHFNGAQQDGNGIIIPAENRRVRPKLVINGEIFPFPVDTALYYDMPIQKFTRIHIQRVIGARGGLNYLLYLYLKDDYLTDNPGRMSAVLQGYYEAKTFYNPPPGSKPSPADYRATLQWKPDIITDASGKATVSFYNNMLTGSMRIMLQGVTESGEPLSQTITYEVK